VDVLFANEDEIAVLGDHDARELVVKLGAGGATWTDGLRSVDVPAADAEVVDTTGAGDAFAAGFLAAWGEGPERALALGVELAGRAVARPGGRP
jgi:sugar/nucleoside kinase (ribokinase family)